MIPHGPNSNGGSKRSRRVEALFPVGGEPCPTRHELQVERFLEMMSSRRREDLV